MATERSSAAEKTKTASSEDILALLHEAKETVLQRLLESPNFTEEHAGILLQRADLSAEFLSTFSTHPEWKKNGSVRLRLARHRHTPRHIALNLLRQIPIFDLVHISTAPAVLPEIRRAAENLMLQRIPQLSAGEKLSLARRGPARIAGAILAGGHPQAMHAALNNPRLTEAQVLRVLASSSISQKVVEAIARHAKWSARREVRLALVRQPKTPLACILRLLPELTTGDLRELCAADLPANLRVYLAREAAQRTEGTDDSASEAERD